MTLVLLALLSLTIFLSFGGPLPFCFGLAMMVMHFCGDITMKGALMYGLQQISSPVLLSIPMFVFAGQLMGESGIAKWLLDFVNIFVGRIKGGLGVVSVITCAIIGAISGSALTGVSAIGPIMIPRMIEEKYPRGFACAGLASCRLSAADAKTSAKTPARTDVGLPYPILRLKKDLREHYSKGGPWGIAFAKQGIRNHDGSE